MTSPAVLCVAIFSLLSTCSAQKLHPCTFGTMSDVSHVNGITTERLSVIEPRHEGASVFIPDSHDPVPGIVFSHSAIHGLNSSADLLRFAWALARAGAASIVLDGTIEWQTPNDDSIRPREFQFCAGKWLLDHANIDVTRAADAGNFKIGFVPISVSYCGVPLAGKVACWPGGVQIGFGQTSAAESRNTDLMLTPQGQLRTAHWMQKQLGLKEINPEWLEDPAQPSVK